jgi:hypothetical protein
MQAMATARPEPPKPIPLLFDTHRLSKVHIKPAGRVARVAPTPSASGSPQDCLCGSHRRQPKQAAGAAQDRRAVLCAGVLAAYDLGINSGALMSPGVST